MNGNVSPVVSSPNVQRKQFAMSEETKFFEIYIVTSTAERAEKDRMIYWFKGSPGTRSKRAEGFKESPGTRSKRAEGLKGS